MLCIGVEERVRYHFDHASHDLDRRWANGAGSGTWVASKDYGNARQIRLRHSAGLPICNSEGLAPYHPINVQTAFKGPVYGTPDGYRLVQIRVSTNYRQKTRFENRAALVDCR